MLLNSASFVQMYRLVTTIHELSTSTELEREGKSFVKSNHIRCVYFCAPACRGVFASLSVSSEPEWVLLSDVLTRDNSSR